MLHRDNPSRFKVVSITRLEWAWGCGGGRWKWPKWRGVTERERELWLYHIINFSDVSFRFYIPTIGHGVVYAETCILYLF